MNNIEYLGSINTARLRGQDARENDVDRLTKEVKKFFKFRGFNWQERYNPVYVCGYARSTGWNKSRLTKAIETVDYRYRLVVNHKLWGHRNEPKNLREVETQELA